MSKKIVIIDYSVGNMFSVKQAFANFGVLAEVTSDLEKIKAADALVLPGVGAFREAMDYLNTMGITNVIKESVEKSKPLLGICLGMQLLFDASEEFGTTQGLGLIEGTIRKFSFENKKVKIPQMGWNEISEPSLNKWNNTILTNIKSGEFMYFVHSYYAEPKNEVDVLSVTEYVGFNYCSAILKKNVVATQFHPEKSSKEGLKIYENWIQNI